MRKARLKKKIETIETIIEVEHLAETPARVVAQSSVQSGEINHKTTINRLREGEAHLT